MAIPAPNRVTMADVGRHAGVSTRTVSNVLSGGAFVRPGTSEKVLRAASELGYRMNTSARSLRTGRTGRISLVIPDLEIDYFSDLARSVMAHAALHDWVVIIQQTGGLRDAELSALAGTGVQETDGMLFHAQALTSEDAELFQTSQALVLLGDRVFGPPVDHVVMPNVAAARTATEHLLALGRRRLAVIGASATGTSAGSGSLRVEGFIEALAHRGLTAPDEYVVVAEDWHLFDGAEAMNGLLDLPVPPDGVFCLNDTLAFGALHAASQRGVAVPGDVAIVGFDNVRMAAYSVPPLTTIDAGTDEIARIAVDLLAERLTTPGRPPVELETHSSLVRRASA